MNVVGIRKDTGKVFESQAYKNGEEKEAITITIQSDAEASGIEVNIVEMTDEELPSVITNSVD